MSERDIDTEPLVRRTPSECGRPGQPCQYEQDRHQLASASRRVERRLDEIATSIGEVRESLARGGVRIEALHDLPQRTAAIESAQQSICTRLGLIERIVYGVCGIIGLVIIGAVLALILRSPA
jgi:hypothetical protein